MTINVAIDSVLIPEFFLLCEFRMGNAQLDSCPFHRRMQRGCLVMYSCEPELSSSIWTIFALDLHQKIQWKREVQKPNRLYSNINTLLWAGNCFIERTLDIVI